MLKQLGQLFQLPAEDRSCLYRSAVAVTAVRLGLWLLPFRILYRLLTRSVDSASSMTAFDQAKAKKIALAIERVSRRVPCASCLTQALAAVILLRYEGLKPQLRIGVSKRQPGRFEAHAWVELGGKVLIGDLSSLAQFKVFPSFERNQL